MYIYKHQNAAGSKITVTATATNIFDLINTAASTSLPNAGFPTKDSNAINLNPENGDIRYLMDGNTPTATNGILVKNGERMMLRNIPLKHMQLIRVTGDVTCSVEIGRSDVGEASSSGVTSSTGGGAATDVNIHDSSGANIVNGQQTMANSVPVVIASDQTAIPVSISAGALALTPSSNQINVAAGPTATPLAGVLTQVDELVIVANLTNTGNIYLGSAAVTTGNGLIMEPGRSVTLESVNLNTVYIQGTAGEGVSFFSLT